MCLCLSMCLFICVSIVYLCLCVSIVSIHVYFCLCLCLYVYVCLCLYVYVCLCLSVYVCLCLSMSMCRSMSTCVNVNVYVYSVQVIGRQLACVQLRFIEQSRVQREGGIILLTTVSEAGHLPRLPLFLCVRVKVNVYPYSVQVIGRYLACVHLRFIEQSRIQREGRIILHCKRGRILERQRDHNKPDPYIE